MKKRVIVLSGIIAAILLILPFLNSYAAVGDVTEEGFVYNGRSLMLSEQSVPDGYSNPGVSSYFGRVFGFDFSADGDTVETFKRKFDYSRYESNKNRNSTTVILKDINDNELNDDAKVGTGTKLVINSNINQNPNYVGGIFQEEYFLDVVYYGDVDGDGTITAIDALAVIKNKTGEIPFTNEIYEEAGRVLSEEGTPNAIDALAIIKHATGKILIDQERGYNPTCFRNKDVEQEIADRLNSDDEDDYLINVAYNPSGTYGWNKELAQYDKYATGTEILNSATGEDFNVSEWRILDVDSETGDVRLVPKNYAEGKVSLSGAMGYNNCVKLLNDACNALYSDSNTGAIARSIKIEDIESIIAENIDLPTEITNPIQPYDAYSSDGSFYPAIYENENLAVIDDDNPVSDGLGLSQQISFIQRAEGTSETSNIGAITTATSIRPYNTYYGMDNDAFTTALGNKSRIILPYGSSTRYYVASRCIQPDSSSCVFSVRSVGSGHLRSSIMFDSNTYYGTGGSSR